MKVCYLSMMSFREHSTVGTRIRAGCMGVFCSVFLGTLSLSAFAETSPSLVRGLWVWKSPTVLEAPRGAEGLRDFCQSEGINEVYVSV